MLALLQRVKYAEVKVEDRIVGRGDEGLLAFVGIETDDTEAKARRLVERILNYRMFPDENDHLNLSLRQLEGDLVLVSQFTLAADTSRGNRASFDSAMNPDDAQVLFSRFVEIAKAAYPKVATGEFGADMKVSLLNDGPVTFLLKI
ncbi:MAG: D-tyrosyl-tRNA(Tyr) deacylase [Succinivibrio sp.]|nr:D-tyrosyl-tRNA(Tyr) deacylase [Succinivibrio sp.]